MKLAPLLLCLGSLPGLAGEEKKPAPAEAKVVLDPFQVRGRAISSFAISIQIQVNREHKKMKIVITDVAPDSDAVQLDLHVGDEIVKINGLPVEDMDPRIGPDSPLGRLLLNRPAGEPLDLEVITRVPRAVTLHAAGPSGVHLPDRR